MNATKWIKLPVLLSKDEMSQLLEEVAPVRLFRVGAVLPQGSGEVSVETFLDQYQAYLDVIQKGERPDVQAFGLVMSRSDATLSKQSVSGGREILRAAYPCVQIQPHTFQLDLETMACRSMVYGSESIPWGLQFSYPHLFEDPTTHQIETVDRRFENTELFRAIQLFIRNQTRATPFSYGEKKVNAPIRLGKQCFSWIGSYPWTEQRGIHVTAHL